MSGHIKCLVNATILRPFLNMNLQNSGLPHPEQLEAIEVELDRLRWKPPPFVGLCRTFRDPRRALVLVPLRQRSRLYLGGLVVVKGGLLKRQRACIEWMHESEQNVAVVRYVDWDASGLFDPLT